MRRFRVYVLVAVTGGFNFASAQAQADTSPRVALMHLVNATRRADWKEMQPYFPAGSKWQSQVENVVRAQDTSRVFSFWLRGVNIDPESLKIRMVAPDTALITTPFRVRGALADFEATMVRRDQRWVLYRTRESFGRRTAVFP